MGCGVGGRFCILLSFGVLGKEPHLVCAVADVAGWLPNVPIPLLFLIEQGFDGIQSDSLLS